jgi:hypothetical protein
MKSARPLVIGLLVLVGAVPLLCGGAIVLTVVLNLVGVIPDAALEPDPRTATVPKPTATPPLFQADQPPKRQSGANWTIRVLSAQRLPNVDDLPAPAGQVWLVVKVRATMTDTLYKDSSRTLYNRHFHLRFNGQDIAADEDGCAAFERGYFTGTFGSHLGTSVTYQESRDRTVIFAVPPAMERFELALLGYKARPVTFTLRQPSSPATPVREPDLARAAARAVRLRVARLQSPLAPAQPRPVDRGPAHCPDLIRSRAGHTWV